MLRIRRKKSGITLIELLVASAIGTIGLLGAGKMIVTIVKANEALNHATDIHRIVVFLGKIASVDVTSYMKEVEKDVATSSGSAQTGYEASMDAHPCRELNLRDKLEVPTATPASAYPKVITDGVLNPVLTQITYKGDRLIEVGNRPGDAKSIELIQMTPRLSHNPAYIHTVLRITSAEINAMSPSQVYDIPFMWTLRATVPGFVTDRCEQGKYMSGHKAACESLGRVWYRNAWRCCSPQAGGPPYAAGTCLDGYTP